MLYQSIIFVSNQFETLWDVITSKLQIKKPIRIEEVRALTGKKSIGVKEVTVLKEWNSTKTSEVHSAIIFGADLLTDQAQNALLKLTEEPNENKLLIFATNNPYALLETIRSRCVVVYDESFLEDLSAVVENIISARFFEREVLLQKLCSEESLPFAQMMIEKIATRFALENNKNFSKIEQVFILSRSLQNQVQKKLIANNLNLIIEEMISHK